MGASQHLGFMWHQIKPFITTLLSEESPDPLKQAAILASPYILWQGTTGHKHLIQLWVSAVSATPHTDEISQSVVDTLLQIAFDGSLQPLIPTSIWSWLNSCPSLPLVCIRHHRAGACTVVKAVQALGDVTILKSYLLLVWSKQGHLYSDSLIEMCTSFREDFSGAKMQHHRDSLLKHLNNVLGQLDQELDYLRQQKPSPDEGDFLWMKEQYGKLKEALLEV